MISAIKQLSIQIVMYVLLEYISQANTWLTVLLKMIVLLEYINLLFIRGCKKVVGLYIRQP